MLRILCSADDLLRVSIAEQPAPLAELTIAMSMMQRKDSHPVFAPWRRHMARRLPAQVRPLLQLVSPLGAGPCFIDPPSPGIGEGLDQVMSSSRATVRAELTRMSGIDRPPTPWLRLLADQDREAWQDLQRALQAAHATLLAEQWPRLRSAFYAETAWRARILAQHGLQTALTSLGLSIRLQGLTLEANFPRDLTIPLTGQGIILCPTLLWTDHLLPAPYPDGRLLLIYPAATPLPLIDSTESTHPLTALLGTTRARTLQLAVRQHTTSELARNLGLSLAAASMQAKALREAGLITSQRDGKAVWHQCTPLGLDLLVASG
ncbi:winged helix-turn-helix domain-containing protein [Nocardia sp. NPDC046473]|uniref:ArsR/SmtB family transcription factor n=1 Tax=Nocardia sp. NPDC046473 TaxID=3155733 RepID=UPI0033E9462A